MDDRDTIRRRVIDRAVTLFANKRLHGGGLFTTANYIQAVGEAVGEAVGDAEFRTAEALSDCREHPSQMDDLIEGAGPGHWRCKTRQGSLVQRTDRAIAETEGPGGVIKQIIADQDTEEAAVTAAGFIIMEAMLDDYSSRNAPLQVWWWIEMVAETTKDALLDDSAIRALHTRNFSRSAQTMDDDDFVEELVGCALYALALSGRVIMKRNTPVGVRDSEHRTVFALVLDLAAAYGPPSGRPPLEGIPR